MQDTIVLRAGEKAEFRAEFEASEVFFLYRTFVLDYRKSEDAQFQAVPLEWFRFKN